MGRVIGGVVSPSFIPDEGPVKGRFPVRKERMGKA